MSDKRKHQAVQDIGSARLCICGGSENYVFKDIQNYKRAALILWELHRVGICMAFVLVYTTVIGGWRIQYYIFIPFFVLYKMRLTLGVS